MIIWESVLEILFPFIGGFGLFIFGMHIMAKSLEQAAGNRLRRLLEKVTDKKYKGVLLGLAVTGIIQSSSATTVMIVGFVNAGIMKVGQTVGIIMGANVGTTVTSWLVSSAEWAVIFKPSTLAPILVGVGAVLVMFAASQKLARIGEIVIGFGILFMGMDIMSSSVEPLSESEAFKNIFETMGRNPLTGILAGTVVTGIIQSSSVSVGILQSLAAAGLVPWGAAVYIIMGQNIGTCVTALLSSIGTSKAAKSTAYIHLMFNIVGSVIFSVVAVLIFKFFLPELAGKDINMTEISLVHTAFNVACTLLFFPFTDWFVKAAMKLAGVKEEIEVSALRLNDQMLRVPNMAFNACENEINRMSELALSNLRYSCEAVVKKDSELAAKVFKQEEDIDLMQRGITRFLAKLCAKPELSEKDNQKATALFHTVNDIERVGDHAENISELANDLIREDVGFSEAAAKEIKEISELAIDCFLHSIKALETKEKTLVNMVKSEESRTDILRDELRENHMKRLSQDECNTISSVVFLDVISNLERVTDHAKNIAQMVERNY